MRELESISRSRANEGLSDVNIGTAHVGAVRQNPFTVLEKAIDRPTSPAVAWLPAHAVCAQNGAGADASYAYAL